MLRARHTVFDRVRKLEEGGGIFAGLGAVRRGFAGCLNFTGLFNRLIWYVTS